MKNDAPKVVKIHDVKIDLEYMQWLGEIKARYHNAQIKAAVRVFLDDSSYESQVAKDLTGRFICEIISRTAAEDKRLTSIEEELNRHLPEETSLDGADETTALRTDKSGFEWIIPGITIPR